MDYINPGGVPQPLFYKCLYNNGFSIWFVYNSITVCCCRNHKSFSVRKLLWKTVFSFNNYAASFHQIHYMASVFTPSIWFLIHVPPQVPGSNHGFALKTLWLITDREVLRSFPVNQKGSKGPRYLQTGQPCLKCLFCAYSGQSSRSHFGQKSFRTPDWKCTTLCFF